MVEFMPIPIWIPLVIKDRWEALRLRSETLQAEHKPKRGWLMEDKVKRNGH